MSALEKEWGPGGAFGGLGLVGLWGSISIKGLHGFKKFRFSFGCEILTGCIRCLGFRVGGMIPNEEPLPAFFIPPAESLRHSGFWALNP